MKLKKTLLLSLLAGSIYASTASAALSCEYIHFGTSFCEAITNNSQMLNTYVWTSEGAVSFSGGGGPFRSASCLYGSCTVKVKVTYPDGSTSDWSRSIPSSRPFLRPPGGGGSWGGTGDHCTGTHIGPGCG